MTAGRARKGEQIRQKEHGHALLDPMVLGCTSGGGRQGTASPEGLPGCAPGQVERAFSTARARPASCGVRHRSEVRELRGAAGCCRVLWGAAGRCSRRAAAVEAKRDLLEPQGWLFAKEQGQRLVQQTFQGSSALSFLTTCENPVCMKGSESLQKTSVSQKLVTHKNRHG